MGKDSSINLTPGRVRMTGSGGKREKLSAWIWCVCFLGASLLLVFSCFSRHHRRFSVLAEGCAAAGTDSDC